MGIIKKKKTGNCDLVPAVIIEKMCDRRRRLWKEIIKVLKSYVSRQAHKDVRKDGAIGLKGI